jgi:hypothetical protein
MGLGPDVGRELLDDLGFLHVPGPPLTPGPAYLFICLRRTPTLRHFDPERIDYWVTPQTQGLAAEIDMSTREPAVSDYAWGPIRIVDRVNASNEFASFGGQLLVARLAELKVAVFSSEAPIAACGGHSQEWEPGSREVSAFLARLRAAADPRRPLEAAISRLSPVARYAAFVSDSLDRLRRSEETFGWASETRPILERERHRLQTDAADEWVAGSDLARQLAEHDQS